MALTVTNLNTLTLLNTLNKTSQAQSTTLERLTTGVRINAGKDDPAGLIATRSLKTELTSIEAAISNNQRTNAMLGVADKALSEVASLLNEISSLSMASANQDGISADELAANQAQIDNAIAAIDRIISTTEFNGKKLLDGSLGINTTGVDSTEITDLQVFSRAPSSTTLNVNVTTAATRAQLQIAATSATDDTQISIQGREGTAIIDIAAGENLSAVAAKINAATAQTGVTASASGGNLTLRSSDFGSAAFVRVSVVDTDTTDTSFSGGNDSGSDAVVTVNGQSAAVDGLNVNYTANGVSVSFNLTESFNQSTGSSSFTISGGGATFQLGTSSSTQATIGIDGLFSQQLGEASLGYLSSLRGGGANSVINNPNQAALIAKAASEQLAKIQGRLGGFQKFQVETALNQMNAAKEGLTAAVSVINDVDYATETAELNRQNVLLQSAISLLGLANQQSAQILALLR